MRTISQRKVRKQILERPRSHHCQGLGPGAWAVGSEPVLLNTTLQEAVPAAGWKVAVGS